MVAGLFVLDKGLTLEADGNAALDAELTPRLEGITQAFIDGVRAAGGQV